MKLTQTKSDKLTRAYEVTVPANDIDTLVTKRLTQLRKTVKIAGFRKGKVPLDMVKKQHGKNIMGEVLQQMVETNSRAALKKEKLRPAYQPAIEVKEFEEGKDLVFSMELEILPEMPKIKPEDIEIRRPKVTISDANVMETLERLAGQAKDFVSVDKPRAAKNGDAVRMDFKGFVGDEAFEGGEGKDHQLELGGGQFIAGFEEQLVGAKAGDKLDVNVTFPEQYHSEKLAGADARFEVTVHDVLEAAPQKVDDALAEKMGLKDLDGLKDVIKGQMEMEVQQAVRFRAKKSLFDVLDALCDFDIPAKMEQREFDMIWQQLEQHKAQNPDDAELNKPEKELRAEYEEMAKRRVRLGILLSDLGAQQKITVSAQELQQAAINEARNYQGQEEQVLEYFKNNPEQMENLRGPILEEKVVDWMLTKVKATEYEVDMKALQEGDDELDTAAKKKPAKKKAAAKKVDSKK